MIHRGHYGHAFAIAFLIATEASLMRFCSFLPSFGRSFSQILGMHADDALAIGREHS
jgi:hypothetical protein